MKSILQDKEKDILKFWEENNIFKKSESINKENSNSLFSKIKNKLFNKDFIFYDGPPFANGMPHYGHILASVIKDAIPRYKTMKGFSVKRIWGWDCHGMPVENEIEKEIGTRTKKEVEEFGVDKFNHLAEKSVFKYVREWREIINRIGRWVDMYDDYRTLNTSFTESVWNIFSRLNDKGLVSKGNKVLNFCPRCSTILAKTEVQEGYELTKDISVYVLFKLLDEKDTFFVSWTTTPWTLFGNAFLQLGKDINYVVAKGDNSKRYIFSKSQFSKMKEIMHGLEIEKEIKGRDLDGVKYEPIFKNVYKERDEKIWKVYLTKYVEDDFGTGIIHSAPPYGEEDMEVARSIGFNYKHHITKEGKFIDDIKELKGELVKKKGNTKTADEKIVPILQELGALFKEEEIEHEYPFCWRCKTPLLNYATDAWFVHSERLIDKMILANKKINWIPPHLREGRFGNWISNSKPWGVSRNRFWGAPIPVWENDGDYIFIDSLKTLKNYLPKRNNFFLTRHSEGEHMIKGVFATDINNDNTKLTSNGKEQSKQKGEELRKILKGRKIDIIISSPFKRCIETAEIISKTIGYKGEIETDERITEWKSKEADGMDRSKLSSNKNYQEIFKNRELSTEDKFENAADCYDRVSKFMFDINKKYEGKSILIVTHKISAECLNSLVNGDVIENYYDYWNTYKKDYYFNFFEYVIKEVDFREFPNKNGRIDLHKPYIDDIIIEKNGKKYKRVSEVFDCWFESGSMPYASNSYPRDKSINPQKNIGFPADFIAEGLDQTRGWFYTLLVIGVGAFNKSPFKNVITTGLVKGKDGKKLSKSLKNYEDPMTIVDKYGADSLRHYLLSSPLSQGQDVNFDEAKIDEIHKKIYLRLNNCLQFLQNYSSFDLREGELSILDEYIYSRLDEVNNNITKSMDEYKLSKAISNIGDFVDDLSTWYIRRSRDVMRDEVKGATARNTCFNVLLDLSKMIAPFAPFYAEYLYMELNKISKQDKESVHLCKWPKIRKLNKKIVKDMERIRNITSIALEKRVEAGIKVRQPLSKITLNTKLNDKESEILKEEVNIQKISFNQNQKEDVVLDTNLTKELKELGFNRELVRTIQQLRKKQGYKITDKIENVYVDCDEEVKSIIERWRDDILKDIQVLNIIFQDKDEAEEFLLNDYKLKIFI